MLNKKRPGGKPFEKGADPRRSKGRPKGALNKSTIAVKDFCLSIVADPKWRASLRRRMIAGKANHAEAYILNLLGGRPKSTVEVQSPDTPSPWAKMIDNMSPAEFDLAVANMQKVLTEAPASGAEAPV